MDKRKVKEVTASVKGVRDLPVVLLECTPSKEAQKKSSASSGMVATLMSPELSFAMHVPSSEKRS